MDIILGMNRIRFDILRYSQKIITILYFCLMGSICYSQSFSIDTLYELALDLTAHTKSVKDANGIYCALIKVISSDIITKVEGNVIESFDNGNEYWIYLSSGTKQIKIFTKHHPPLHIYPELFAAWSVISINISFKT